jgi:hypothetical protein
VLPAVVLASLLAASAAGAEGQILRADLVEARSIKLDGIPKEWSNFFALPYTLKGKSGKPDLEARAALAYDANSLFVAAEVVDDTLRGGGGDRVEVVLGFPGGATYAIELYPGDPGRIAGAAKTSDGRAIAGAKVVEAPNASGWSLEASVPWSAFPPAQSVRVGLRGAVLVYDVDSGSAVKNIVGTAPSAGYASLPPLNTESEQALADGLVHDKNLHGAPRFNLVADVAGDSMKERVLVLDRYLVVLGSNFRHGSEYYFADLGVDGPNLLSCETRDVTGDGQAEILLRKRFVSGSKSREALQILSFGSREVPTMIFEHEVAITTDTGSITNEVSFVPDGARTVIKIAPGTARGFTVDTYREPTETSYDPALLPWGPIRSQTYQLSGTAFVKTSEEKQAPTLPRATGGGSDMPTAPPPPSAGELLEKVYDLYKRDRGVSGRPRFDRAIDVAGDARPERVLLHDRDLVVFGKGFKGGTGYTYLTLQQFASSADILDLSARDITGDGKAEILVKGVMHGNGPAGPVDREVVLVFQVVGDTLRRVFAAETARSMGARRVNGSMRFTGTGIELAPGTAVGWTERTYPFGQDTGPVGGYEPLLLPWSNLSPARYRWTGSGFGR